MHITYYIGKKFESSSAETPEFKRFAKDFKDFISGILSPNSKLVSFSKGHFQVSGFIKLTRYFDGRDRYCYFSVPDVRFNDNWHENILLRRAESPRDYTGGTNRFVSLDKIKETIGALTV